MKKRVLVMLSALLCLGMLWATWSKGRQLEDLRSKQKELLAQVSDDSGTAPPAVASPPTQKTADDTNTSELLHLRAEINRLTRRKQELASAQSENLRLKAELASAGTN